MFRGLTSLINLGAAVIKKYKPHRLPKCNTSKAKNGGAVASDAIGGKSFDFEIVSPSDFSI